MQWEVRTVAEPELQVFLALCFVSDGSSGESALGAQQII